MGPRKDNITEAKINQRTFLKRRERLGKKCFNWLNRMRTRERLLNVVSERSLVNMNVTGFME